MNTPLSEEALDILFREARSFSHWLDRPVGEEQLRGIYELMKWGPTSANCTPARLLFIRSDEAKARLKPCLDPGNVAKSMSAPVVTVVAMDMEFYELLPRLFPHADARSWYAGRPAFIHETAFRNSSLQGGYLILAARAVGLDCGPMSGFDAERLDREFFPEGRYKSNFLCAIGYGDRARIYPRDTRLTFEEACTIA